MSATNVYRDTTAADLLNNQRMQLLSQITPSGSGANNFTPDYVLPINDIIDITDSVTLNGGLQSPSDVIDITDSVTATFQNSGTFLIDSAEIDFSDVA